ncbi:MAG: folate family ECF transporter S component [Lachnospiraceae bacterium]|nr:folate family ECF transporter S component [Lachnospiraceae bacterium]
MEKTRRNTWTASASELRRLKVLTACGMMCALALVLNMTTTFNIGPYIRIGVSGIPSQVVDYLFGPVVGGIFGGVLDIVKYVLRPDGNFFPGFTISGIMGGMIYGTILYRQRPTVLRILAAQAAVKTVVNIGLNSVWLHMLYGQALAALLPARCVSNLVMLPVDTLILYLVLRVLDGPMKRILAEE